MSDEDKMKIAKAKAKSIVDAAKEKANVSIDMAKAKAAITIEKAKVKAKKYIEAKVLFLAKVKKSQKEGSSPHKIIGEGTGSSRLGNLPKELLQEMLAHTDSKTAMSLKRTSTSFNALIPQLNVLPVEYFSSNHPSFMKAFNDALWKYRTDKSSSEIVNNNNNIEPYAKYLKIKEIIEILHPNGDDFDTTLTAENMTDLTNIPIKELTETLYPNGDDFDTTDKITAENMTDVTVYNIPIRMFFELINATTNAVRDIPQRIRFINQLRQLFKHKAYLYDNNNDARKQNILVAFELSKLQINISLDMTRRIDKIVELDGFLEALQYVTYYQQNGLAGYIEIAHIYTQLYYHYVHIYIFKQTLDHRLIQLRLADYYDVVVKIEKTKKNLEQKALELFEQARDMKDNPVIKINVNTHFTITADEQISWMTTDKKAPMLKKLIKTYIDFIRNDKTNYLKSSRTISFDVIHSGV